jgi:ligand-binding SRPBCC domain-containing protein
MPAIELAIEIRAPIERVFDLARSIDLHVVSTEGSGERAVAGVTSGLIELGEEVTWRARHFGIWLQLTSRITAYQPPEYFRDLLARGAFRRFDHDHVFEPHNEITVMRDRFDFESPSGVLGRTADALFLSRYMKALLLKRNAVIKMVADSNEWRRFLR